MRILFCNIAYMKYYDPKIPDDSPRHGGSYVRDTGDALEKINFSICSDGIVRGFVETKYHDSAKYHQVPNSLHIEKIDSKYKKSESIPNVTVVFCAHSDALKKTVIVGWYKDATVYRGRKYFDNCQYNIQTSSDNAILLPESKRTFMIPRAGNGLCGFGQSNTWFALEEDAKSLVDDVIRYIDEN